MKDLKLNSERVIHAIEQLRQGKFIIVYDADGREEESDFIIPSEFVTPESVRTMRKEGGGLIFLMVANEIGQKLELPFLTDLYQQNWEAFRIFKALIPDDIPYDTNSSFSLTINHRNTFTGITDIDRALTMTKFANLAKNVMMMENGNAIKKFGSDFRSPGHVPICLASEQPLKTRFGHTELSVALMKMAGLMPIAAGCEIMGDDGNSKTKREVNKYAEDNNLIYLDGWEIVEAWNEWSK
ncbi:MAG: 3,4-dihydroxy-2-butanone-4-phosphate synthase [Thermoplasmata archaeon]|nr:3,4-dihydroxy-2-butanone-4-phosphate synthase [Thermoplasmata archaeon]